MQDDSIYFKVVSLLLQYPDEAYVGALPELKAAVKQLHRGHRRAAIEAFIADLEACSDLQLQERYTALFDMSPSTTMNLTYHLYGDGEKRARLLTHLQQEYARAGFEKNSSELPDFLPMILEFMSAVPQAKRSESIQVSLEGIETLVDHLKPIATPFAVLLEPLAGMFRGQAEERAAASVK